MYLPEEIILHVFLFVDVSDLQNRCVNRHLARGSFWEGVARNCRSNIIASSGI